MYVAMFGVIKNEQPIGRQKRLLGLPGEKEEGEKQRCMQEKCQKKLQKMQNGREVKTHETKCRLI